MLAPVDPLVRHFRQIVIWPLQLMPVRPGEQVQRHWELLDACAGSTPWTRVPDAFAGGAGAFRERHYREFVTFLPYVQRLLYGAAAGQEAASNAGTRSLHIYRRTDVHRVRLVCQRGEPPRELLVDRVELFFFLDACREVSRDVDAAVRILVEDVVARGDAAVIAATERFDRFTLTSATMRVSRDHRRTC